MQGLQSHPGLFLIFSWPFDTICVDPPDPLLHAVTALLSAHVGTLPTPHSEPVWAKAACSGEGSGWEFFVMPHVPAEAETVPERRRGTGV